MDLRKCILTNNACYKTGQKIIVKGVMWHSTGANNPNLKRYVQPDDGKLGVNPNGNHWNQYAPDGREVCVHAFIGKDKNGKVCTYQTLPWNYRGWHCGGSGNNSYIGFEMCEDALNDRSYFNAVYEEAVELTAYLCKLYDLNPNGSNVIICHQDGYKLGIASNHSDVYPWFNKFGKTMADVRRDVAKAMGVVSTTTPSISTPSSGSSSYSGNSIVDYLDSIGKDSSFAARKKYADQYGISNYEGTAAQNLELLDKMRSGSSSSSSSSSTYTGNSLVDYLKSIGKPSDYPSRAKLAAQYGIKSYAGTAEQNTRLLNMLRGGSKPTSTISKGSSYYKVFNNSSIVDGLKSIGVDSGFSNRKRIAKANGISNYTGSASQNSKLCSLARAGKLKKA